MSLAKILHCVFNDVCRTQLFASDEQEKKKSKCVNLLVSKSGLSDFSKLLRIYIFAK